MNKAAPSKNTLRARWLLWLALTAAALAGFFVVLLQPGQNKSLLLPGQTTHGHFQIELACEECHESAFSDTKVLQASCERCHGQELKEAMDAHPLAKFRDPRNSSRVAVLDARLCVTCHKEHEPEITQPMGLSLPVDYCYRCHQSITQERPSHEGMPFESCASSGCHNFHDNRALYEDFLASHGGEPNVLPLPLVPARKARTQAAQGVSAETPLTHQLDAQQLAAFRSSAHHVAGTKCSDCHGEGTWVSAPAAERCESCHTLEVAGWKRGRHGMRVGSGLPPMRAVDARLPMKNADAHTALGCGSCHEAHGYDTRKAAAEACSGCHDDEHSRNYLGSNHARLWAAELAGTAPAGSGVSCATCHMPRLVTEAGVRVQHNQNDDLRPNEKMVRPVCGNCHGIGFALDALADPELVKKNFSGQPARHIASVDMAVQRIKK